MVRTTFRAAQPLSDPSYADLVKIGRCLHIDDVEEGVEKRCLVPQRVTNSIKRLTRNVLWFAPVQPMSEHSYYGNVTFVVKWETMLQKLGPNLYLLDQAIYNSRSYTRIVLTSADYDRVLQRVDLDSDTSALTKSWIGFRHAKSCLNKRSYGPHELQIAIEVNESDARWVFQHSELFANNHSLANTPFTGNMPRKGKGGSFESYRCFKFNTAQNKACQYAITMEVSREYAAKIFKKQMAFLTPATVGPVPSFTPEDSLAVIFRCFLTLVNHEDQNNKLKKSSVKTKSEMAARRPAVSAITTGVELLSLNAEKTSAKPSPILRKQPPVNVDIEKPIFRIVSTNSPSLGNIPSRADSLTRNNPSAKSRQAPTLSSRPQESSNNQMNSTVFPPSLANKSIPVARKSIHIISEASQGISTFSQPSTSKAIVTGAKKLPHAGPIVQTTTTNPEMSSQKPIHNLLFSPRTKIIVKAAEGQRTSAFPQHVVYGFPNTAVKQNFTTQNSKSPEAVITTYSKDEDQTPRTSLQKKVVIPVERAPVRSLVSSHTSNSVSPGEAVVGASSRSRSTASVSPNCDYYLQDSSATVSSLSASKNNFPSAPPQKAVIKISDSSKEVPKVLPGRQPYGAHAFAQISRPATKMTQLSNSAASSYSSGNALPSSERSVSGVRASRLSSVNLKESPVAESKTPSKFESVSYKPKISGSAELRTPVSKSSPKRSVPGLTESSQESSRESFASFNPRSNASGDHLFTLGGKASKDESSKHIYRETEDPFSGSHPQRTRYQDLVPPKDELTCPSVVEKHHSSDFSTSKTSKYGVDRYNTISGKNLPISIRRTAISYADTSIAPGMSQNTQNSPKEATNSTLSRGLSPGHSVGDSGNQASLNRPPPASMSTSNTVRTSNHKTSTLFSKLFRALFGTRTLHDSVSSNASEFNDRQRASVRQSTTLPSKTEKNSAQHCDVGTANLSPMQKNRTMEGKIPLKGAEISFGGTGDASKEGTARKAVKVAAYQSSSAASGCQESPNVSKLNTSNCVRSPSSNEDLLVRGTPIKLNPPEERHRAFLGSHYKARANPGTIHSSASNHKIEAEVSARTPASALCTKICSPTRNVVKSDAAATSNNRVTVPTISTIRRETELKKTAARKELKSMSPAQYAGSSSLSLLDTLPLKKRPDHGTSDCSTDRAHYYSDLRGLSVRLLDLTNDISRRRLSSRE